MTTETGIQVMFPRNEKMDGDQWDAAGIPQDKRVPPPKYRHAAPSAPWPWMDLDHDDATVVPLTPGADEPWSRYPQSHFGNWTEEQVRRCRMLTICKDEGTCQMHRVDVLEDGTFEKFEEEAQTRSIPRDDTSAWQLWDDLHKPVENLRVRAIFIENVTSDVLRIFGARYNIEPFFFASSANWIPSQYQENPLHGEGDHITVVLPFICSVKNQRPTNPSQPPPEKGTETIDRKQTIDTQAPLILSDQRILLQDLLAIHMVRHREGNTIISYHHQSDLQKTTARRLRSLVQRTGDSVYWQKLYSKSKDPTFVFLAILWYALYAWDEALQVLYAHLSEQLEAKTTDAKIGASHTRELHKLQAHLLYYEQLLRDFQKSVEFVRDTRNPAMLDESISDFDRESSQNMLKLESENLLDEIQRLDKQRLVQSDRLKNAMTLAFSAVNIQDNATMKELTTATLQDSAVVKRISYLTMILLPANYLSSVFGMNVLEMVGHTSGHYHLFVYVGCTVVLTLITAWVVIALQSYSFFHSNRPGDRRIVQCIAWPVFYVYELLKKMRDKIQEWRCRDTIQN